MKRLDLVQLAIIIVGICSMFLFLESMPQLMYNFITWFKDGLSGSYAMEALIGTLLINGMYIGVTIYCIKRSKHLAGWICNTANLSADINFALNKGELLFSLFVGLGIYGLIKNLPILLVRVFNRIKGSSNLSDSLNGIHITNEEIGIKVMTLLFYFVLVYYAKVFADFFEKKINNVEPDDAIGNKISD